MVEPFEWRRLLLGEDLAFLFFWEVVFRTLVMFGVLLVFFRFSGKKQIKQLSIYDVILIVGLGSAAGDPMFYADVPLLHAVLVFVVIFGLYRGVTWLAQRSHRLDVWLEGDARRVVAHNLVENHVLEQEGLANEELYTALRRQRVSQLGQVDRVYLEAAGNFSVFFREDAEVIAGLPLFPEELAAGKKHIPEPGSFSCVHCGNTKIYEQPDAHPVCGHCGHERWIRAVKRRRLN